MKLNKIVLSTVAAATLMATGACAFDAAGVFEKDCQGCHGPNHEGGVGSDLRPKVISKKNSYNLSDVILNGKAGISPEMAVRLSIAFNTSSESWLNQQSQYDLWQAEQHRKELDVSHLYVA